MNSEKLITKDIPTLRLSNSGLEALSLMQEFHLSHLAVVENNSLKGLLSEELIWNMHDQNNDISTVADKLELNFEQAERDIFEIINYMNRHNLSLLPILAKEKYIGSISRQSLVSALASISAIQESGGVIVLKMKKMDYSMSEISQIIEGNNAKILSAFVTDVDDNDIIKLTIKLNIIDIAPIIQTFERFNYTVFASYNYSETNDSLSDRYDSLMRYLNP
ncbi:MAG: CBS domain-containing protein [Flavobacteriales bacterium]